MPLLLVACSWFDGPSVLDAPPTDGPVTRAVAHVQSAIPLARRTDFTQLDLPPSNRPEGRDAPKKFGLIGPFELHERGKKADIYKTPLPVHSNLLPTKLRGTHSFGSGSPPGFRVDDGPTSLVFDKGAKEPGSFGFSREHLYVGVASDGPAPDAAAFELRFPRASNTENDLNRAHTRFEDDTTFTFRSVTLDEQSTTGLYLPAPAQISWELTVPEAAVLTLRGTILPPAIRRKKQSDGATVVLELLDGEQVLSENRVEVALEEWVDVRWDVGAHAGKTLTLNIRTEHGDSELFDYVFLEDPTLYTPKENPQRALLVFVDTLRPDHLGVYGHTRETSPTIDKLAAHGAVFHQARTVAPWTLPSA